MVVIAGATLAAAGAAPTRRDADSFQRKLLDIENYSTAVLPGSRLTPISEGELNSYIRLDLATLMPAGVEQPWVDIVGEGRVSGEAVVDLDAVRRSRPSRGLFDPMNLATGRMKVTAAGLLRTDDGQAWLDVDSATIAGMPVPILVLQEVVAYYTRSPQYPRGVNLDEPFPLPARIKEIHVREDQAVIVQR
jgi:hypothetical protein